MAGRTQLFGGRMTAEEVHQKYAFPAGAKCRCGRRPMTRAIVMMEMDEAFKRDPSLAVAQQIMPQEIAKVLVPIKTAGGIRPYIRVSITYACQECTPELEKACAKAPSHAIVEINRFRKDRFVSGAAGGSSV